MNRWLYLFLCAALFYATATSAQSVQQSGAVTPGHPAMWVTNGVVGDGGSTAQGALTGIGVTANGPAICQNSGSITGAYNQLCFTVTGSGGGFSLYNYGGATGGFTLNYNGVTQGFGTVNLPTTTGDFSCFVNSTGTMHDCGVAPTDLPFVVGTTPIQGGTAPCFLVNSTGTTSACDALGSGVVTAIGNPVDTTGGLGTVGISGSTVCLLNAACTRSNTVTIDSPANSTTPALVTSSSAPSSGSSGTTLNFNMLAGTNSGYEITGSTLDTFGLLPSNSTLRVNMTSGVEGIPIAITGAALETAASGNLVGVNGTAYSNISASSDFLWGVIGYTNAGPSSNIDAAIAVEGESAIATGGTVAYRAGVSAASLGPTSGTTLDTAFMVSVGAAVTGSPPYATANPWVNAFSFESGLSSIAPLTTTGNVFYSDNSFTTGSFANLPNITFSGNLFNFAHLAINGAGRGVLGAGSASIPNAPDLFNITCSSCGVVENFASTNSTTGFDGVQEGDSSGNITLFSGVSEASRTTTIFGQTSGGFAQITANGTSNTGLLLGTVGNEPLIIGTNDTAWLTLSGGGAAVWSGGSVNNTCTSCGNVQTLAETNSTSGFDLLQIRDSSTNIISSLAVFEASNNSTAFGQTLGGFAKLASAGSSNLGLIVGTTTSEPLILGTNNTARLTISGSGAVTLNGNPLGTSGSWTPAITASVTAGTPAYSVQVGSYTQNNNVINAWFSIVLSGWTGSPSGNVTITGLPVTSTSTSNDYGGCILSNFAVSSSVSEMGGYVAPSSTSVGLSYVAAGGANVTSAVTATVTGTTPTLRGYCSYHT